jgi:hypothetical protein
MRVCRMNFQRQFKKKTGGFFPFYSPTERGPADIAEPMGEELQDGRG